MKAIFLLLLIIGSCSNEHKSCIIKEVTIKYINWSIMRSTPIPVSAFWSKNPQISDIRTLKIQEPDFIRNFNNLIDSASNLTESKGIIDTRISCLIRYDNCFTDTISFGRTHEMKINSESFNLDKQFLRLIASKLPTEQLEMLKDELDFNPKKFNDRE